MPGGNGCVREGDRYLAALMDVQTDCSKERHCVAIRHSPPSIARASSHRVRFLTDHSGSKINEWGPHTSARSIQNPEKNRNKIQHLTQASQSSLSLGQAEMALNFQAWGFQGMLSRVPGPLLPCTSTRGLEDIRTEMSRFGVQKENMRT